MGPTWGEEITEKAVTRRPATGPATGTAVVDGPIDRPEVPVLTFLGAAGTVTGSRFLVDTPEARVLVDAGLFQGLKALRLRNGLYIQRHAPMLRIAVPYGLLSSRQLRALASIARRYDRGFGHFTTRQNLQLNWPKLEDVPDILAELADVQMHAIQTSGNCVRNVTADHLAGRGALPLRGGRGRRARLRGPPRQRRRHRGRPAVLARAVRDPQRGACGARDRRRRAAPRAGAATRSTPCPRRGTGTGRR